MQTKWGKKLFQFTIPQQIGAYSATPYTANTSYSTHKCAIDGKDYTGASKYFAPLTGSYGLSLIANAVSSASNGIALGSGTTAPTDEDYTLEHQITGISGTISSGNQFSIGYDSTEDKYYFYLDITVTNNNAESITIAEIGKYGQYYFSATKGNSPGSNDKTAVLVDRTLLDTPVTIPAGEAAIIRYMFEAVLE